MKKILPLVVIGLALAGCSSSTTEKSVSTAPVSDPTQAAVTAFLKKSLDDPASYQPARWGKAQPWRQKDVDALAAQDAAEKANIAYTYTKKAARFTTPSGRKLFADNAAQTKRFQLLEDSLLRSTDTTHLGQVITHAYRAKNKMGALQLDSAQFIVLKNGQVKKL